jgi:type II secretory pathway pseudopilin PulG
MRTEGGRIARPGMRTHGMTLVELLATVCLLAALTSMALAATVGRGIAAAKRSAQQRNIRQIEGALELFHARQARYPASLDELTSGTDKADEFSHTGDMLYLAALPPNPLGEWGYDGQGRVWPINGRGVSGSSGTPAVITTPTPYHFGALFALVLSFVGSLAANFAIPLIATGWQALLGASVQAVVFRHRAWEHLLRSAWLGLAKDLIHSEGDLRSLIRYSAPVPLALGPALHGLTARLRAHLQRQAMDYTIPIRRSQWKPAVANLHKLGPHDASASVSPAGAVRARLVQVTGIALAVAGGVLAVLACRAACRPLLTDVASLALLSTAILLTANLLGPSCSLRAR